MNTSDHAYDYDGLDYTYLETQEFADFIVTVKRAIRTMTRQNKKMKVPHGDKNRPYGATVSDMKRVLGNVPADWLYSALRNLEGEGSGATWPVALAHSKKRRMIQDRDDYFEVALLCQTCHENVEFSGHENMERAIREIIERRQ